MSPCSQNHEARYDYLKPILDEIGDLFSKESIDHYINGKMNNGIDRFRNFFELTIANGGIKSIPVDIRDKSINSELRHKLNIYVTICDALADMNSKSFSLPKNRFQTLVISYDWSVIPEPLKALVPFVTRFYCSDDGKRQELIDDVLSSINDKALAVEFGELFNKDRYEIFYKWVDEKINEDRPEATAFIFAQIFLMESGLTWQQ
jgi:hypothetical protein